MADQDTRPLTEDERAELEALRAEKARREEEERARRERAELEALRAEQAAAESGAATAEPAAAPVSVPSPARPQPAQRAQAPAAPDGPVVAADPAERTFGQRMVLSSDEDEDGLPSMPPAQKLIIGICIVGFICFAAYIALSNAGALG